MSARGFNGDVRSLAGGSVRGDRDTDAGAAAERGYPVPARKHRSEEVIRGSRFLTVLARAATEDEAAAFVEEIRAELPDATHHCWAYNAGPPGDTARIGMSDAGEPHGTAGRPMLDALLHSGVGEIVAVVTRYYGGTKLGRGGLGRAYSGGVTGALEGLPLVRKVDRIRVRIEIEYAALDAVLRFLEREAGRKEAEEYAEDVVIVAALPRDALAELRRRVAELTSGEGRVTRLD